MRQIVIDYAIQPGMENFKERLLFVNKGDYFSYVKAVTITYLSSWLL